jgi:hypothetical protein
MRRFLAFSPILLVLGHAAARSALAFAGESWRPWTHELVALRLAADLGLCAWAIGGGRLRSAVLRRRKSAA